ncbi:ABC transporter substrate-binding protein [Caballeronia sp. LP006]|jgi:putative spermidine/putrescine transport system substrate-binding protein|uniref:ABC transporter substrate-binding protein n=1 Tax=unclassified Caballeronia TaxID=2646786 RepID=UPI001FD551A4|nr:MULTISPECIES: ABC transporter substrate-binding protein [unclassified Caballeronia]MDR5774581.1 ABC transporter substrate-binding protein [Caballeronia sp. LZ002]MDR5799810.1 ABC transporter substrate-binding protein [Caballeronia sp. LZ001]MDR5828043.1 ABC transporter substrate-binding protein [Caballeronia sp. LP006]MDR5850017.1 ABC transporter substrate-binding protein [Caballeronia sp. LZ003]
MRTFIKTQCAALALCAFSSITVQAAETLSVVTFGGAYEAAAKKAYFEPFTQATGVGFSTESYDGGLAKLSAMEQAKNTTWDLIDLETNDAITACDEGLLMKFDKKTLGKTSDFIPGSILDCAVASMVWSTVYAYDASKLKTAPTSVNDFFDLQKFPGKRGLRKSPKVTMEWALIADGVDPKDVYKVLGTPAGVDRAFKKLDTIKKNIVWWESGAQAPQLLADGAVAMTQVYNGRIDDAAKKDNKPFKAVWDAQVYDFEWWGIPTGAKNANTAAKFIISASQPKAYADLTKYIAYAPPRKDAIELVDKQRLADLPTSPANFKRAVQINANFWADNADQINKRFQVWLTQ